MNKCFETFDVEQEPASSLCNELILEVERGLAQRPRSLAPWIFYDQQGSALFEKITTLPEYYLTSAERLILSDYAGSIITQSGARDWLPLRIVELGAGTATKTGLLLEAASVLRTEITYIPVDVSSEALEQACRNIECAFTGVRTEPLQSNYVTNPLELEPFNGSTLVLYLGSSIGNFSPAEARTILCNISRQLRPGDGLVLGTDLVKDPATLIAAYDDSQGVTAAFNLNILNRLNRDLDADFNLDCFTHLARWNSVESRIEMHLESICDQTVSVLAANRTLQFRKYETIHTENSYKFTDASIVALLRDSQLRLANTWKDRLGRYALTLACPME